MSRTLTFPSVATITADMGPAITNFGQVAKAFAPVALDAFGPAASSLGDITQPNSTRRQIDELLGGHGIREAMRTLDQFSLGQAAQQFAVGYDASVAASISYQSVKQAEATATAFQLITAVPKNVIDQSQALLFGINDDSARQMKSLVASVTGAESQVQALVGWAGNASFDQLVALNRQAHTVTNGPAMELFEQWNSKEREFASHFERLCRMPDWAVDLELSQNKAWKQAADFGRLSADLNLPSAGQISLSVFGATALSQLGALLAIPDPIPVVRAIERLDWADIESRAHRQESRLRRRSKASTETTHFRKRHLENQDAIATRLKLIDGRLGRIEERQVETNGILLAQAPPSLITKVSAGAFKWALKRFVWASVLSLLPNPHVADPEPPTTVLVANCAHVMIRSEPARSGSIVTTVGYGALLYQHGEEGQWINVIFFDPNHRGVSASGWVYQSCTQAVAPETLESIRTEIAGNPRPTIH